MAGDFFIPILLAAFIATVSFPITSWLRTRRVPLPIAVLLTVLVDFAFLTGIVIIVITLTGDLESKWEDKYKDALTDKIEEVSGTVVDLLDKWQIPVGSTSVEQFGDGSQLFGSGKNDADVGEDIVDNSNDRSQLFDWGKDVGGDGEGIIDRGQLFSWGGAVAGWLVSFLGSTLLILILTVFMLSEARMFGRRVNAILEARGPNLDRIMSATADIQRYLAMKTVVSLATGLLAGFLCWAAGLDFYVLWGIVAFALNFIPVIGSIIAGVPPFVLAYLVDGGPSALAVGIGYISINIFLGNFLEPMLMGRRFGLSTLVVIISVLFWGFVWGPVGMFLAVPLTMVLKVMLDNSDELRWMAVAITKEKRHPILDLEGVEGELDVNAMIADEIDLSGIAPEKRS